MVTIIPKPPKKVPQWQQIIFYVSLVLLLTVVIVYFVLNHLNQKSQATLEGLEEQILNTSTVENIKTETQVMTSQQKINDFSKLLSDYNESSQFFDFLEKKTHPDVWFTDLDLNPGLANVKLSGVALNFQTLAQQLYIFQGEDLIKEAKLTDLSLGEEGETKFSLELSLSPEMFK